MSAAPGTTWRVAVVGVCCVVAALSYSGAVTLLALFAFVLPSLVLVTVVTAVAARSSLRVAAVVGLAVALGVAEVVNVVSGTGNGPAARSTFVAAGCTAVAVAVALGPAPTLFTAAVAGVVVGALGLGAGAEVAPVAVATAVVVVLALAVIEAQDRHWERRPPQLVTVVVGALLVGALSASIALQADRQLEGEPAVLAPGSVEPSIQAPQVLEPDDPPDSAESPVTDPPPKEPTNWLAIIWLVVGAVVLALLLIVLFRILWVALAWRRLRRRLRRGSARDQVAGAWVWSTRRLRAAGWPMPASLSADAVAAGEGSAELPRGVRAPLRQVALSTVDATYAPTPTEPEAASDWAAADEVGRGAVSALRWSQRLGFALRPISSTPPRPAASAPATPEENRT